MTIQQAVQYDPATDGMTDPEFVTAWIDAQVADLTASGLDYATASSMTYAVLDALDS